MADANKMAVFISLSLADIQLYELDSATRRTFITHSIEGHVERHLLNMTSVEYMKWLMRETDGERFLMLNFYLADAVVELLLMQTELFFSILVSCTIKVGNWAAHCFYIL